MLCRQVTVLILAEELHAGHGIGLAGHHLLINVRHEAPLVNGGYPRLGLVMVATAELDERMPPDHPGLFNLILGLIRLLIGRVPVIILFRLALVLLRHAEATQSTGGGCHRLR